MSKALTFFRVFDLAFFAPGAVICLTLWHLSGTQGLLPTTQGPAEVTVLILGFIAATFCSGLVIHSIVWSIRDVLSTPNNNWTAFPNRFSGETRDDLILYFWYLRATCWNVALALTMLTLVAWSTPSLIPAAVRSHPLISTIAAVLSIAALVRQGIGFDRTLKRSWETTGREVTEPEGGG